MRVLITATGSHGDINPFIAVGRALIARGHQAAFLANPYFKAQAEEAGLEFIGIGETFELRDLRNYPDVMHPRKGGKVVINDWLGPFADDMMRMLPGLLDSLKPDVVLHHHIAFAAPWACERRGVPCANAVLAPMMWMNPNDTISPMWWSPLHPGPAFRWGFRHVGLPMLRWQLNGWLNPMRRRHGLPASKDCWQDLSRSGAVNLGLWSPVFRGPLDEDPPNAVITGFARHDRHGPQEQPPEDVERFLAEGEPPILFSLGTAAVHVAGRFYHDAAEACRLLNRRGMLLIANTDLKFDHLPNGVRTFTYIPFSQVMPRVAASVHHGGIGTTGQAMAAGRPTVVVPHAHDQYDNAARVKRLGVSETLIRGRLSPRRLADSLRTVLDDPAFSQRAADVSRRMTDENGALKAALEIERVAAPTRSGQSSQAAAAR
jgi:UDP:flavonoid glycosyltransferase YjiC (YdhE family)